jgi:hypothetical protein
LKNKIVEKESLARNGKITEGRTNFFKTIKESSAKEKEGLEKFQRG